MFGKKQTSAALHTINPPSNTVQLNASTGDETAEGGSSMPKKLPNKLYMVVELFKDAAAVYLLKSRPRHDLQFGAVERKWNAVRSDGQRAGSFMLLIQIWSEQRFRSIKTGTTNGLEEYDHFHLLGENARLPGGGRRASFSQCQSAEVQLG
jgi:hypothetical protein